MLFCGEVLIPRKYRILLFKYYGLFANKLVLLKLYSVNMKIKEQHYKKVPVKLKHKIYKTVIRPTMTYGADCWTMKKKDGVLMNKT